MRISVVTPVYNEEKNVPELYRELSSVLRGMGVEYEIIAVNDRSTDGTAAALDAIAAKDPHFAVVHFRANHGQTAALMAGIDRAKGEIIVAIDSDLENDPADIPKLVAKLGEGFDIVSGWRTERWADRKVLRKIPSMSANWLIARMTGVRLHDHGCTLKAYRREVFDDVRLYGEMHRFIAAYLAIRGARVTELPVAHRPRIHGESKYGFSRVFRVILDLVLIAFLQRYMNRPMHFFGGLGFIALALGIIAGTTAVLFKIFDFRDFVATPLPIFSALLLIIGVVLIAMGILAEMVMRVYYEGQGKRPYTVGRHLNVVE